MAIFQPLAPADRQKLRAALRRNAENDLPIVMDRRDTSFISSADPSAVTDEEVINAIRSVPCHY